MNDHFAITFFGALFAIMNPFVNLPVFLSLTEGETEAERRGTALKVTAFVAAFCLAIPLTGMRILDFFGVSVDAFRAAGGFVLATIAFAMLHGVESMTHHGSAAEKAEHAGRDDVSFYPLAFPMLVGPGTITTLVLYAQQAEGASDWAAYAAVTAAVVGALGAVMYFASLLGRHLNQTMRVIMTRLMGMILLAIAVEMVAAGLKALLPGLA